MDGNGAGFARKMLSLVVCHSLVVIVEADVFGGQELEASYLVAVLLRQADEIGTVLLLGVGVVDDYALSLEDLFFGYFVTLLFGLQGITIHSRVLRHVVLPESGFA